jgi:UDP-N-acetylmuramoyl-tripeptide--D-alanyl-D-alanine ligase
VEAWPDGRDAATESAGDEDAVEAWPDGRDAATESAGEVKLTAAEIAAATGGEILVGSPDAAASSFGIDSRLLGPGACFVAIDDARDGHDFVPDAVSRGAVIAVVQHAVDTGGADATLVRVDEPMAALAALGRAARARLTNATVVGITGSAGKTATKDLTAAALAPARRVHASPASFNNEAGLPLTLLGAPDDVEVVVAEMGARFEGNISHLAEIARPRVGVITNVGMAHAGHLGGRDGVAKVKGELLDALPPSGVAVLNDDCDVTDSLARRTTARVLRVGRGAGADVRATEITLDGDLRARFRLDTPFGAADVSLQLRGEHQVENAAMAAGVATALDVPVEVAAAGLSAARPAAHRMDLVRSPDGLVVLNDAYNSSPTSAAAALRSLAQLDVPGRRIAVLGDMLELGDHAADEHEALGALAAALGIDAIVAVGEHAGSIARGAGSAVTVVVVDDVDAAVRTVDEAARPGDAVLVKASRAVGLEGVADAVTRGRVAP